MLASSLAKLTKQPVVLYTQASCVGAVVIGQKQSLVFLVFIQGKKVVFLCSWYSIGTFSLFVVLRIGSNVWKGSNSECMHFFDENWYFLTHCIFMLDIAKWAWNWFVRPTKYFSHLAPLIQSFGFSVQRVIQGNCAHTHTQSESKLLRFFVTEVVDIVLQIKSFNGSIHVYFSPPSILLKSICYYFDEHFNAWKETVFIHV